MLAGFLGAMRTLAPTATYTCCVPFTLAPLQQRFPAITWLPYDRATRAKCIRECDLWLGLGGSPFQSANSRWFIDHLVEEAGTCTREQKPMFFLGVGVQTANELTVPDVRRVCAQSAGIWTRDPASAERIAALPSPPPVDAAADLAHLFFREVHPPAAKAGRMTLVVNFDFGAWPGQSAFMEAMEKLPAREHIWLAQESRPLPGAERAMYASLSPAARSQWQLVSPESPGADLSDVLARWPSGEWLVTARYHAALAGAWSGSSIIVLATNEKLRAAASEIQAPLLSPAADETTLLRSLAGAESIRPPVELAKRAYSACEAFVRSAVAHPR